MCRPTRANDERGDRSQRARQPGERAELHGPLRRREGQQQQPDRGGADQPPHRARCDAGQVSAAQQHGDHPEQAEQHHQHGEPAGQRRVGAVLDGEEVVAQELLIPGDGRADDVLDAGGLGDGGQRLVPEDDHEDQRQRRRKRGDLRQHAVDGPAGPDVAGNGPGADQDRSQRDEPLRRGRDAEHRDDDRHRRGPQPARADGVLHQHPRGDGAERDDRLRAKAVVERQPCGQEHRARGQDGDPVERRSACRAGAARSG